MNRHHLKEPFTLHNIPLQHFQPLNQQLYHQHLYHRLYIQLYFPPATQRHVHRHFTPQRFLRHLIQLMNQQPVHRENQQKKQLVARRKKRKRKNRVQQLVNPVYRKDLVHRVDHVKGDGNHVEIGKLIQEDTQIMIQQVNLINKVNQSITTRKHVLIKMNIVDIGLIWDIVPIHNSEIICKKHVVPHVKDWIKISTMMLMYVSTTIHIVNIGQVLVVVPRPNFKST